MGRIKWHGGKAKAESVSPLAAHIGRQLLACRQRHQVSMHKMHDDTGLAVAFICDLENGRRNPSAATLWKLSMYFNVPVGWFFRGYDEADDG